MKQLLVIGASGQLGRTFCQLLERQQRKFIALDMTHIDLSRPEEMVLSLENISAVINCAAFTNVDEAETHESDATTINGTAVGELARQCLEAGIPLVHYSTDYVFDGASTSPYRPDHPYAPLNAYGRSKALGEELLKSSGAEYLLIRTSWVYAPWGNNFALTMAKLMKSKTELRIVDDQQGRPTHVEGLAARTLALLDGGHRGDYHITDGGQCTWFEFTQAIAEVLKTDCQLLPCSTAEFPRPAPRPAYSVLDTSRADALLGAPIHYKERLRQMQDVLKQAA